VRGTNGPGGRCGARYERPGGAVRWSPASATHPPRRLVPRLRPSRREGEYGCQSSSTSSPWVKWLQIKLFTLPLGGSAVRYERPGEGRGALVAGVRHAPSPKARASPSTLPEGG